ncbi:MAG: hypothetical protein ACERKU_07505, partial [Nitrospirota bacterium]
QPSGTISVTPSDCSTPIRNPVVLLAGSVKLKLPPLEKSKVNTVLSAGFASFMIVMIHPSTGPICASALFVEETIEHKINTSTKTKSERLVMHPFCQEGFKLEL